MFKKEDDTWKVLIGLTALSISLACALIIFEGLFVSITFAWPPTVEVCRIGTGIWAGLMSAICSMTLLMILCRRKDDFTSLKTLVFSTITCSLSIAFDCVLIVLESLCFVTDTKSPLPIFLLSVGVLCALCSICEIVLLHIFWRSSKIWQKENESKKIDQRRTIIIPNILPSYPSFVSVELN